MNLDELRSVQEAERRKDSLQHLRDDFYEAVAAYISDLKSSRDRRAEAVDQPFSDEQVRQLSDEIETAEDIVESLYERRVGKVVKLSSFAAADMPVEEEGMTSQEHELFCDLVDRIKHNKSTVLAVLAGESPTDSDRTGGPPMDSDSSEPHSQATPSPNETASSQATNPTAAEESVLADAMSNGDDTAPAGDTTATPAAAVDEHEESVSTAQSQTETSPIESAAASAAETDVNSSPTSAETDSTPKSTDQTHTPIAPDTTHDGVPPDVPVDDADSSAQTEPDRPAENADGTPRSTTETAPVSDGGRTEADGNPRQTVRITKNVGSILGVDEREYTLRADDVVQLPELNATPLVERNAAEPID